jgi:phosphoribosylamine-glycine ligase
LIFFFLRESIMPRLSRSSLVILAVCMLLAAGCQKFKYDQDIDFKDGDLQFRTIDGFRSDRKVTVTITANDNPVVAAIIPEAQYEDLKMTGGVNAAVVLEAWKKNALDMTEKPGKDVTLTATIPAKKDFRICIYTTGKNTAHLKIVSD